MRSVALIRNVFAAAFFLGIVPVSAQWTQHNGPWAGQVTGLAAKNGTVFAGTFCGLFMSTDNGTTWTRGDCPIGGIISLAVKDSAVYAGTFGAFMVTRDNGKSWMDLSAGLPANFELFTIAIKDGVIYTGFDDDPIHYSTDNGVTWTNTNQLTTTFHLWTYLDALFASTDHGLYRSINNGTTWTAVDSTHDALAFIVVDTTILVGTNKGIIRSVDRGVTWESYGEAGTEIESEISDFCTVNGVIFAASPDGVYRSSDRGAHWVLSDSGIVGQSIGRLAVNGSAIFAGSIPRGVYRSLDNGVSWDLTVKGMTNLNVNDILISGDQIAAGCDGGIMLSWDKGKNWQWADIARNIFVLSVVKKDNVLLAGTLGNGLYRSLDNGRQWNLIDSSAGWFESLKTGSSGFFGIIRENFMFSADSGVSWEMRLAEKPIGAFTVNGDTVTAGTVKHLFRSVNSGTTWDTVDTADLGNYAYPLHLVQSGGMLFSADVRGIRRSNDNGNHWTRVGTGLGDSSVYCIATNGKALFTGTSSHGVYVSLNNGESWASAGMVTPFGDIYALAADATMLYAGTMGYGLLERPIADFSGSIGRNIRTVHDGRLDVRTSSPGTGGDYCLVTFSVSRMEHVTVTFFDMSGREVASVVDARLAPGTYRHRVNTAGLSTGCYITQMKAGSNSASSIFNLAR
jgi:hypothetical protein